MVNETALILLKGTAYFFLSVNFVYAALLFFSWRKILGTMRTNKTTQELPPVTFLIPAYNEETLIVETIQTYLSLPHQKKEIIVVNDGSQDKTMALLQVMFQLRKVEHVTGRMFVSITHPELKVVNAPHMGKAGALNFGLRFAINELVCTMDADTIPTVRGVQECLSAFAQDPKLIAAGGVIQVLPCEELKNGSLKENKRAQLLTRFQRIEYLRAFVCERLGWSFLGSEILISGAFCMVKKEAIRSIGGFSPRSITEDFDLIVRLRKLYRGNDHRFTILPVTVCFTQAPRTLFHLSRQRMRWQLGLVQTLLQNGSLFLHPRHGLLGLFAVPYFWLVEALSPLVALIALAVVPYAVLSELIPLTMVVLYFSAGVGFNLLITLCGIFMDEKYVSRKYSWNLLEGIKDTVGLHLGYKQLTLWWRLMGLLKAAAKAPSWGEKPRVEVIQRPS